MDILLLRRESINLILTNWRTWEIRSKSTSRLGRVYLGTSDGTIFGEVTITEVIKLDENIYNENEGKHRSSLTWENLVKWHKSPYAWVLANPKPYSVNRHFICPPKAICWAPEDSIISRALEIDLVNCG